MAEALSPNFWRKLWYTPWPDLLRGRLSRRLDWRLAVAAADLPPPARNRVADTVQRTQLWPSEQLAVAHELLAHFRDALDGGAAVDQALEEFGDERQAATLIRRAKRRNRPIAWRALVISLRIFEVVLATHLLLAAWFYAGHPSPRVDYVARLNEPILATPLDQRAWPLYREAILQTRDFKVPDSRTAVDNPVLGDPAPGDPRWVSVADYLHRHGDALRLARQAAARPVFGFLLGRDGSVNDPAVFPEWADRRHDHDELVRMPLPYQFSLRKLAQLLSFDALQCATDHNSPQYVADFGAMLQIAGQLQRQGDAMDCLIATSMRGGAMQMLAGTLTTSPQFFSDADLINSAHLLARAPATLAQASDLHLMPLMEADLIQRMYTRSDSAWARLTPEGFRRESQNLLPLIDSADRTNTIVVGPLCMLLASDPREAMAQYQQMFDEANATLAASPAEVSLASGPEPWGRLEHSSLGNFRYPSVAAANLYVRGLRMNALMRVGDRAGLEVALALELYRRQDGHYPADLQTLTPALLPEVPIDPFTGGPVRYRLMDGRPVIYSVGSDRKDHGGHPSTVRGRMYPWAALDNPGPETTPGDWVLFPPGSLLLDKH